jgi:hypothetical protein
MTSNTRTEVRHAVGLAVRHWPNAHLGDVTPREDIRSAFLMIRNRLNRGEPIQSAIGAVLSSAYSHADM